MRVYAAELICSTGVLGFQTFQPVFCMYNKLRLHAEILKEEFRLGTCASYNSKFNFIVYKTFGSVLMNDLREICLGQSRKRDDIRDFSWGFLSYVPTYFNNHKQTECRMIAW